jgi:hypothetical protein
MRPSPPAVDTFFEDSIVMITTEGVGHQTGQRHPSRACPRRCGQEDEAPFRPVSSTATRPGPWSLVRAPSLALRMKASARSPKQLATSPLMVVSTIPGQSGKQTGWAHELIGDAEGELGWERTEAIVLVADLAGEEVDRRLGCAVAETAMSKPYTTPQATHVCKTLT